MSPTLALLAQEGGAQVIGDDGAKVSGLAPLDQAGPEQLSFLSNPLYLPQVGASRAGAIIVSRKDYEALSAQGQAAQRNWLIAANPYASFARIAQWFERRARPTVIAGIHPTAVVAAEAVVPASCSIGPNVVIEAGARLGERVRIIANCFIGEGVEVGDDSVLNAHVSVYHACVIGARCIVHSGVVIGSDGFGFAPDFGPTGGEWVKIPQTGRAVIGDDVEIGANTTIDRGAMADTVIERGCKLDNQIQIAHNVHVGAYSVVAGCAAIAGSTKVGRYCIIGGSANLAGHLTIADKVTISGGTSITKSISASGHFTSVFPFMPHTEWERNAAIVRGLGRLRSRVQHIEKQISSRASEE